MRYTKYYTVKEWKRFDKVAERENGIDITFQEVLLKKYDVILTDHKTKKEKVFGMIDKFNIKNFNSGITKFNKGVESFTKAIESTAPKKGPNLDGLKPRKMKGNTVSFWDEDQKTRKKRNKRKDKQPDYSFITGKRKTKFF